MDSSHYISPSLWEEEKSIVVTLMDKLDITLLGTHMSVMTLSSEVEFPIPFNGYRDKVDLKRKIAELPYNYHSGLSRVDLGACSILVSRSPYNRSVRLLLLMVFIPKCKSFNDRAISKCLGSWESYIINPIYRRRASD